MTPGAKAPDWESENGRVTLYCRDALAVLPRMRGIDCWLVDPPYSSGGMFRGDRMASTGDKYVLTGTERLLPDFAGDSRDQRSWLTWCALWLSMMHEASSRVGTLFTFTDWRQLPSMCDAIQCGGWLWRGIIPWNKSEATRPQKGWFRAQCEYVITATAGPMAQEQERGGTCLSGLFTELMLASEKLHQTQKPTALLTWLLTNTPETGTVCDCFMGSGSTCIAALRTGRRFIGVERDEVNFNVAKERIIRELQSPQLPGLTPAPAHVELELGI